MWRSQAFLASAISFSVIGWVAGVVGDGCVDACGVVAVPAADGAVVLGCLGGVDGEGWVEGCGADGVEVCAYEAVMVPAMTKAASVASAWTLIGFLSLGSPGRTLQRRGAFGMPVQAKRLVR